MMSIRRRIASVVLGAAALGIAGGGSAAAQCELQVQELPVGVLVVQVCAADVQRTSGNPDTVASTPLSVGVVGSGQGALVAVGFAASQGESTYDSGRRTRSTTIGPALGVIIPAAVGTGGASAAVGFTQEHTTRADGSVKDTTTIGADVAAVVPPVATSGVTHVSAFFRQERDGDACTQEVIVTAMVADVPQAVAVPLGECAAEVPEAPAFPAP